MERICERRAADGLPGLAVQWGAIGDVGLVADMQEDNKELVIGGTLQQRISSCLQELDGFLNQESPIVSSMVVAEKRAGSGSSTNVVDTVLNIMGKTEVLFFDLADKYAPITYELKVITEGMKLMIHVVLTVREYIVSNTEIGHSKSSQKRGRKKLLNG